MQKDLEIKKDLNIKKDLDIEIFLKLVRLMGLEPIRLLTHAPQTCLSAYSSTTAYLIISAAFTKPLNIYYINSSLFLCQ